MADSGSGIVGVCAAAPPAPRIAPDETRSSAVVKRALSVRMIPLLFSPESQ